MEMFLVAKFTCSYNEWKSVYDGDLELRKTFMKDDVVGKVDEHTAMIKATITDPEKMEKVMMKNLYLRPLHLQLQVAMKRKRNKVKMLLQRIII